MLRFLALLVVLASCGVLNPLVVGVEVNTSSGKPPLPVEFKIRANGALQNFVCELDAEGDGSYEQKKENCTAETRFNHTYTNAGNYKVGLRVLDPKGNITTYNLTIRAEGAPVIEALTATPSLGNAPFQTTFIWQLSDPNQDSLKCLLDVDGDGTNEYTLPNCTSATTQSHTFTTPGAFGAKLSVDDGRGEVSTRVVAVAADGKSCSPAPALVQPVQTKAERLGRAQWAEPRGLGSFEAAMVPGELLIRGGELAISGRTVGLPRVSMIVHDSGWKVLKVKPGQERQVARTLLAAGAHYVQPNYRYKTLAVPNDPLYYSQRAQLNSLMGLECAWDIEQGNSSPVRIAVLDDGVDTQHPDLKNRLLLPAGVKLDVAQNDTDPSHANTFGHGSLVAGVLGAQAGNKEGMAGANWGSLIVPIKIFKDDDTSSTALIIEAMALARSASVDAQIINLSLCLVDDANPQFCSTQTDAALEAAMQAAKSEGRIVVASGGNDGRGQVAYPAASTAAIAVGAIQNNKDRASFSNYGSGLDLVAPGVALLTTNPTHRQTANLGPYIQTQGTSFSAPLVSAAVALYMSRYKALKGQWPTPERVYTCLTITAEDLGTPGPDEQFGSGLVRVDRMLTGVTSDSYCFP